LSWNHTCIVFASLKSQIINEINSVFGFLKLITLWICRYFYFWQIFANKHFEVDLKLGKRFLIWDIRCQRCLVLASLKSQFINGICKDFCIFQRNNILKLKFIDIYGGLINYIWQKFTHQHYVVDKKWKERNGC